MIPNKKSLEIVLSALRGFEKPIPKLEQYATPSDIAADLLWHAYMDSNIEGKKVFDLGCGTGILGIGASLLGAKKVVGYDIDKNALKIAKENLEMIKETRVELGKVEFIENNAKEIIQKCDTVVMNPPFGVQNEHADKTFLEKAFKISKKVYSIHKFGSDDFLLKFAKDNKFAGIKLAEFKFIIKKSMKFHEKMRYPVKVDLWKFFKNQEGD